MSVMRPQRAKVKPKEEVAYFSSLGKDRDGFTMKYINSFKGRGVFSSCSFQKGVFPTEYRGEVISKQERENRLRVYHDAQKVFMFEFHYNGKTLWFPLKHNLMKTPLSQTAPKLTRFQLTHNLKT
ncbi:N-lysine methyltransferase KMT5A-A-like isoform X1 [Vanacampus margaritifer]